LKQKANYKGRKLEKKIETLTKIPKSKLTWPWYGLLKLSLDDLVCKKQILQTI